jgi:nucleotide-binding universal stress UspA family protein
MTEADSEVPFVKSVFHASDFDRESELAFAHALAIALMRQTRLAILHAGDRVEEDWERFPAVRETLTRWGLLEPGSPRHDVFRKLSVEVTKVNAQGKPAAAMTRFITEHEPDLLVLATEGRKGLARWLHPSVAERVARRTHTMSLFVPKDGRGFVSPDDGSTSLRRILVPVDRLPDPTRAVVLATRAAEALGEPPCEITLLHVGSTHPPANDYPKGERWRFDERLQPGDVVDTILESGEKADLIVMATDGRNGPLDALRGSHTERVVRGAHCPVLAVPVV